MLLSASLTTLLALGTMVQAQSGGFGATCHEANIGYGGTGKLSGYTKGYWLFATCGNGHGGYNYDASLFLGACVDNINGQLKFLPNGAFGNSCVHGELSGTTLWAYCGDGKGGYDATTIDLNTIVGNINGNLIC